jgi:hypothetical protein
MPESIDNQNSRKDNLIDYNKKIKESIEKANI